jgi:hypothetical protein
LGVREHGKGIRSLWEGVGDVAAAENAHLKTSPNLSATRIVRPERVSAICDGFFGISLRVVIVRGRWEKRGEEERGGAPLAQELQAIEGPDFELLVVAGRGQVREINADCGTAYGPRFQ